jgi:hypothetical protein
MMNANLPLAFPSDSDGSRSRRSSAFDFTYILSTREGGLDGETTERRVVTEARARRSGGGRDRSARRGAARSSVRGDERRRDAPVEYDADRDDGRYREDDRHQDGGHLVLVAPTAAGAEESARVPSDEKVGIEVVFRTLNGGRRLVIVAPTAADAEESAHVRVRSGVPFTSLFISHVGL